MPGRSPGHLRPVGSMRGLGRVGGLGKQLPGLLFEGRDGVGARGPPERGFRLAREVHECLGKSSNSSMIGVKATLQSSFQGRERRQRSGRSASHCMPSPMLLY